MKIKKENSKNISLCKLINSMKTNKSLKSKLDLEKIFTKRYAHKMVTIRGWGDKPILEYKDISIFSHLLKNLKVKHVQTIKKLRNHPYFQNVENFSFKGNWVNFDKQMMNIDERINPNKIKKLSLVDVFSKKKLSSIFPNVKELSLNYCHFVEPISFPLNRLEINFFNQEINWNVMKNSLKILDLSSYNFNDYILFLPKLKELHLDLLVITVWNYDNPSPNCNELIKILKELHEKKIFQNLRINCFQWNESLYKSFKDLYFFTELYAKSIEPSKYIFEMNLMQLQKINLETIPDFRKISDQNKKIDYKSLVFNFLKSFLNCKSIEFKFTPNNNPLIFVEIILKNFRELKRLNLQDFDIFNLNMKNLENDFDVSPFLEFDDFRFNSKFSNVAIVIDNFFTASYYELKLKNFTLFFLNH